MPTASGFSFELNWQQFMWYFNQNIGVMFGAAAITVAVVLIKMMANAVIGWAKKAKPRGTTDRAVFLQRDKKDETAKIELTTSTDPRAAPPDTEDWIYQISDGETHIETAAPASVSPDLNASGFYEIANQAMSEGKVSFADIARVTDVSHTNWAEKAQEILIIAASGSTLQEEQKDAQDDQQMAQPDPTPDDPGEAQRKAARTRRINRWRQLIEFLVDFAKKASGVIAQVINRSRKQYQPNAPVSEQMIQDSMGALAEMVEIQTANDPDPAVGRRGRIVRVLGVDPRNKYDLRYELVELSALVASNTETGAINPEYPTELQPRDRSRMASRTQIQRIAAQLEPDAMLSETHSLDRGAMIVGPDDVVESGNGRTLAIRLAAQEYPDQYQRYRSRLYEVIGEYGIDPGSIEGMDQPVLIRRRMSDVDRVEFAREANQSAILEMGAAEHAHNDASLISTEMLMSFEILDGQGVEDAIRSAKNRGFVAGFVGGMDQNARGRMMDETGNLSQEGVRRIAGAMLGRVFPDSDMAGRLFEDTDNDIKNVTGGIMRSLGRLARAEEMSRTGQRGDDLLLADDLATAVEKMAALRSGGMDVPMYLAQGQMFERELNTVQEDLLLGLYKRRRSAKAISEWIDEWVDLVDKSPDPRQGSLFGSAETPRREELMERWGGKTPAALQSGFAF